MTGRPDLERWPTPPAGISEPELFQGYSGLAAGRRRAWPDPIPTAETIRRSLAAATDDDPVDGAGSRDDVAAAETVARP